MPRAAIRSNASCGSSGRGLDRRHAAHRAFCRIVRSDHQRPSRRGWPVPCGWPTGWCWRSACIPARRRCSRPKSGSPCWRRSARRWRARPAASSPASTFADLVVTAAQRGRRHHPDPRRLRDATDFDYEMQMAGMNGAMAPDVQTVFLPASPAVRPITATLVRQIAGMGGDVSAFVPAPVAARLKKKFAANRLQTRRSHPGDDMIRRCRSVLVRACIRRAGVRRNANLANPAALNEQAPATYKVQIRHQQGRVRRRGASRLGAERRRSLLQSGQERLLRQRPFLPRDLRLHGAVRHQRRSDALVGVARGAHQGRSGQAEQHARLHHLRDRRARTPAPPRCSSTSATIAASTARASRRSAQVISGMNVVDALYSGLRRRRAARRGPDQGRIQSEGNAYLTAHFPSSTTSRRRRSCRSVLPASAINRNATMTG